MKVAGESLLLCQKNGIDGSSITSIISWMMELYEKGIITDEDTDGIPLEWGSREAIISLIHKITKREGIGNILADGMKQAAEKIGKGAEEYATHTKGLPSLAFYISTHRAIALATALSTRGDWTRGLPVVEYSKQVVLPVMGLDEKTYNEIKMGYEDKAQKIAGTKKAADISGYEGKAALVRWSEDSIIISDMLGTCKFIGSHYIEMPVTQEILAEALSLSLGRTVTSDMLWEAAKRIRQVERAFDVREGMTRNDDTVPKRFFESFPDGRFKGDILDSKKFEQMKDEYYELRGWDIKTGIPTRETLTNIGLRDVADDLEKYIPKEKLNI